MIVGLRNALRFDTVVSWRVGIVPHTGIFGYAGAYAAFERGQEWLEQSLEYYAGNRNFANYFVIVHMTQLCINNPKATYFSWIDCTGLGLNATPKNTSRNSVLCSAMGVVTVRTLVICSDCECLSTFFLDDGLEMMRKALIANK